MSKTIITVIVLTGLLAFAIFTPPFVNIGSIFKREKNLPKVEIENIETLNTQGPENIPLLSTVATNLKIPWAMAFLPDGKLFINERTGRILLINFSTDNTSESIALIKVKNIGESGLHGIALHPDFENNNLVYLYYTYEDNGDQTKNRVSRFTFDGKTLKDETFIVNNIPGARFHDGGRIKFGPDNFLYITTGDALDPPLAQDTNSLSGKILKVTENGSPAPDNPFNNLTYTYGHRNPQGITWDEQGRLWATEHGQTATDELNLIEKGNNYGWPIIRGDQTQDGLQNPAVQSGSSTWAPAGTAYLNGSIFFTGLRGQALYEYKLNSPASTVTEHFKDQLGRIREIIVGPDNMLYVTTSNRDGRGIPSSEDDRIIRINPTKL